MARFREIERGWDTTTSDAFNLSDSSDVGDGPTNWTTILSWENLSGEDDEPFDTESNMDFYFERIIVDFQTFVVPTALNLTKSLRFWAGLAIVDESVALKESLDASVISNSLVSAEFRGNDGVHRLLCADRYKVGIESAPQSSSPTNALHSQLEDNSRRLFFDVQQKVFLRKGEWLIFVASKCGRNDDFTEWLDGDSMDIAVYSQMLIRKKRGR